MKGRRRMLNQFVPEGEVPLQKRASLTVVKILIVIPMVGVNCAGGNRHGTKDDTLKLIIVWELGVGRNKTVCLV